MCGGISQGAHGISSFPMKVLLSWLSAIFLGILHTSLLSSNKLSAPVKGDSKGIVVVEYKITSDSTVFYSIIYSHSVASFANNYAA